MQIVYTLVGAPNLHTRYGQLARTPSGNYCWDEKVRLLSDHAVVATRGRFGATIGILKFDFQELSTNERALKSHATYVWPLYRGIGIADRLWDTAISRLGITSVIVSVISDRGKTLVDTLRERHPDVRFCVKEEASRPLRSLKGAKPGTFRKCA